MNKVWDEVEFLGVESFLQFDNTIFGGQGLACPDRQSNFRVLRRATSQKGLCGLPGFFACKKNLNKAIKYFPILDSCVEVNILSHSSCRIP